MDTVSKNRIALLHPKIRDAVSSVLKESDSAKLNIRITQGYRSIEEQDKLYAQGRTMGSQVVTNARGGKSWHNYGLAFDFCLINPDSSVSWNQDDERWDRFVKIALNHDFEWGGHWTHPDYPHFQQRFGLSIDKAYNFYCNKKTDEQGYIRI